MIVNSGGLIGASDLRLRAVHVPACDPAVTTTGPAARRTVPIAAGSWAPAPAASALDQLGTVFGQLFDEGGDALYERIEKVLIDSAYAYCQRTQVHTADLLGISRNVLRTQLKRLGLLPGSKPLTTDDGDTDDTTDSQGFSTRSFATV